MGLHPNKPIISWKHRDQKYSYYASPTLNVLRTLTLACSWTKPSCLPLPIIPREDHTAYPCPGKDQNSKFDIWFLLNVYNFAHCYLEKSLGRIIISWGPLYLLST